MSNSFAKLSHFFKRLNLYCAILGAGLLFFIATIICIEVVGRALGAPSRLWVLETSEYSLLYISFLGAPYLLEKNMHVVIDIVYTSLTKNLRLFFQGLNSVLGFLVCITLTIVGIMVVVDQYGLGVREVTVMQPLSWWLTAALPLGTGLMSIQFIEKFFRTLKGKAL